MARRYLRPFLAAAAAILLAALPAAAAAQSGTLAISATVLSKSNCKFSGGGATALAFGDIDPSTAGPKTAVATRAFSCQGSASTASFSITANGGLYNSGTTRRMRHGALPTEFLAYALTLSPTSGLLAKNTVQTLTVTGTIDQSAYQNANVGAYSDTVTITLSP